MKQTICQRKNYKFRAGCLQQKNPCLLHTSAYIAKTRQIINDSVPWNGIFKSPAGFFSKAGAPAGIWTNKYAYIAAVEMAVSRTYLRLKLPPSWQPVRGCILMFAFPGKQFFRRTGLHFPRYIAKERNHRKEDHCGDGFRQIMDKNHSQLR